MKFEKLVIDEVVKVAKKNGIEPAALMAVVEIESAGRALEDDGKTPRLLFERHVFYRELNKRAPNKLQEADRQGLVRVKWDRATQYKDQGSSKNRLILIERARKIDGECANRSASWGVGQTMGFLAEELGFSNANVMLKFMVDGGIPAQVDCMVREIKRKKLDVKLTNQDWAGFARVYNGPGYAANQYDTKLSAAYDKWLSALDPNDPETGEAPVEVPTTRHSEPPKTITQSKTIWSVIMQVFGVMGAGISALFDWRIVIAFLVVIVLLALFIGRERIRKLYDEVVI